MPRQDELPLIYSCSGCSSAAEAADQIARRMDRQGLAEMSCIAGVGGKVGPLVARAKAARVIVAVDGCPLACARACLANIGLTPDLHLDLSRLGLAKRLHASPTEEELASAEARVADQLRALHGVGAAS